MNRGRIMTLENVGAAMVAVLVIVAIFAPWLAPHDPTIVVAPTFGDPGTPSLAFPMGTDELGRDVLSRIIFGARISLTVGVAAMAVTMTIGIAIGLCSGFFGGAVDFILMRFTDLMLSLPPLTQTWVHDARETSAAPLPLVRPQPSDGPAPALEIARLFCTRIQTLGITWFLSGDPRYRDRAKLELLAVCAFPDWAGDEFLVTAL